MNVLVAENDKITRDQAVVGLENFDAFKVDVSKGMSALDMIRQKDYAFVLIGINPGDNTGTDLLRDIREKDSNLDVIVVASEIICKNMTREKIHTNIFAFIKKPIDPLVYHQTINRLRLRILERR
jgi:DNA-binding NtrC family response regulator